MGDFWSVIGRNIGRVHVGLEHASKEAERLWQEAGQKFEEVSQAVAGPEPVNIAELADQQRVAYAGALLAFAQADGTLDKDELLFLFELVDLDGLQAASKQQIQQYMVTSPPFAGMLGEFSAADDVLRHALMLQLIEMAWINDIVADAQRALLKQAQQALNINDEQYAAIERFAAEMRRLRLRGQNDNLAAEAAKNAVAGLTAVGVPIAAVYVSGSVVGLSAAGITSGLAAVGLGLGMVPGIGMAVLIGAGVFMGVRYLLDAGQERAKEQLREEAVRKSQLVIQNLHELINTLMEQVTQLQVDAAQSAANREAILRLTELLRNLKQTAARRQAVLDAIS